MPPKLNQGPRGLLFSLSSKEPHRKVGYRPKAQTIRRYGRVLFVAMAMLVLVSLPAPRSGSSFDALRTTLADRLAPASVSAQAQAWRDESAGVFGDRVADLLRVTVPGSATQALIMLDAERGIYRSTDGGQRWTNVNLPGAEPEDRVVALTSSATTPSRVDAALEGTGSRLATSLDGGATWTVAPGPPSSWGYDRIVSTGEARWLTAVSQPYHIWKSGSEGWSQHRVQLSLSQGGIDALLAVPGSAEVYVHSGAALIHSEGDPDAWTLDLAPETTPAFVVDRAAMAEGGRAYAVGRGVGDGEEAPWRLMRRNSGDGEWLAGAWPSGHADARAALLVAEGADVVLGLEDGSLHRSADGGGSWQTVATKMPRPSVAWIEAETGALWMGSDGAGLFRFEGAGAPVPFGSSPADVVGVVAPADPGVDASFMVARHATDPEPGTTVGLVGGGTHVLYRAEPDQAWTRVGGAETLGDALFASPDFARDRRLFSGRKQSSDAGATWRDFGKGPNDKTPSIAAVGPISGSHPVLVALEDPYRDGQAGSGLLLSADGGETWRHLIPRLGRVLDVEIAPTSRFDLEMFVVTERGVVLRSEDEGPFREVGNIPSRLPLRNVFDLAVSPTFDLDQTLMVAVEEQRTRDEELRALAFFSFDAGETWIQYGLGLAPQVRPRKMLLSPNFAFDGVAFLGTERRPNDPPLPSLYRTQGHLEPWQSEIGLPAGSHVRALAISGSLEDGRLYAAAGAGGIWSRRLNDAPRPTHTPSPTWLPPTRVPTFTPSATPGQGTPTATPDTRPSPTPTRIPAGPTLTPLPTVATPTSWPTRPPVSIEREIYIPRVFQGR